MSTSKEIIVATEVSEVRELVNGWKSKGLQIGLVPTMGFLHSGHKSLIDRAVSENDRVVVSIFVNPIQFGPSEDLDTYPRDFQADMGLCQSAGADLIFHPSAKEMYPEGFVTHVDVDELTSGLCGQSRPTHFRGVTTVVSKLFNITSADRSYFGEKDAQQLAVIRRMVRDLNFDIEVIGCPIVREIDGLAKSSRNKYLNQEERKAACVLNQALNAGENAMKSGVKETSALIKLISDVIEREPLAKIDYVSIVDSMSLKTVSQVKASVLIAVAVRIGETRLIDNFTFIPS